MLNLNYMQYVRNLKQLLRVFVIWESVPRQLCALRGCYVFGGKLKAQRPPFNSICWSLKGFTNEKKNTKRLGIGEIRQCCTISECGFDQVYYCYGDCCDFSSIPARQHLNLHHWMYQLLFWTSCCQHGRPTCLRLQFSQLQQSNHSKSAQMLSRCCQSLFHVDALQVAENFSLHWCAMTSCLYLCMLSLLQPRHQFANFSRCRKRC